jgi:hypothetical protein
VDVDRLKQALSAEPDTLPGLPGNAGPRRWPCSQSGGIWASAKLPE